MVTLSKIIEGLEMVDDIVDCYYNPEKDEIFLSSIGEYENLSEDEIDTKLANIGHQKIPQYLRANFYTKICCCGYEDFII